MLLVSERFPERCIYMQVPWQYSSVNLLIINRMCVHSWVHAVYMLYVSVKGLVSDSGFLRDACVKLESVYIPVRVQMSREDWKREARTWVVLHPSNTTPPTQYKPTGPPGPCSSSIHQPGPCTTPKAKDLPESVRGWYMDLSRATETHTSCPVNTAEAAGSPA